MKRFRLKQTKWFWKSVALVVILSGILVIIFLFPSGREKSEDLARISPSAVPNEPAPSGVQHVTSVTVEEMESFLAAVKNKRSGHDPFLSTGEEKWKQFLGSIKNRPPRLEGVIQLGSARVAIINQSRYREGDEVQGFQIVKISDKQVLLSKGGSTCRIYVIE